MNPTSESHNTRPRDIPPWLLGLLRTVVFLLAGLAVSGDGATTFTEPPRILPLGNSITQSDTSHSSYRRALWLMLDSAGYNVDFVGSQCENFRGPPPDSCFDPDHEGHYGYRADQVRDSLALYLDSVPTPDIVLMHLGHNDMKEDSALSAIIRHTLADYDSIITILRVVNPAVTVLLSNTIPSDPERDRKPRESDMKRPERLDSLRCRIPAFVDSVTTLESPVLLVDHTVGFDPSTMLFDGVHPNDTGERVMARIWYDALIGVLGEAPITIVSSRPGFPGVSPEAAIKPFGVDVWRSPGRIAVSGLDPSRTCLMRLLDVSGRLLDSRRAAGGGTTHFVRTPETALFLKLTIGSIEIGQRVPAVK